MQMKLPTLLILAPLAFAGCVPAGSTHRTPAPVDAEAPVLRNDTVHVAPPTGEREADRASILAALERARPGDVVQFGPGTYLVGELIPIETPQLTMLGHANGTTLRGCELASYEQVERDRQAVWDDVQARLLIMNRCGVFEMTGGHGTIRGLTFEHTWMGLALGWQGSEDRVTDGGYLVENNVFRNSGNAVRGGNLSSTPTVIRGNRFINVFRALSAGALTVQLLDNDISRPDRIVLPQGAGFAIGISAAEDCVIEGNRIEGHPSGIFLYGSPGKASRRNVIRDNVITGAGFPLGLWADQEDAEAIQIEDNLIERNRIMGGVAGIVLNRASGNRILDNTISGHGRGSVARRGERRRTLALAGQRRERNRRQHVRGHRDLPHRTRGRQQPRGAAQRERRSSGPRDGEPGRNCRDRSRPARCVLDSSPVGYGRGRSVREQVRPGPRHPDALPRLRWLRTAGDLRSQESR
jgi:parallel beta-helix repeat protein